MTFLLLVSPLGTLTAVLVAAVERLAHGATVQARRTGVVHCLTRPLLVPHESSPGSVGGTSTLSGVVGEVVAAKGEALWNRRWEWLHWKGH